MVVNWIEIQLPRQTFLEWEYKTQSQLPSLGNVMRMSHHVLWMKSDREEFRMTLRKKMPEEEKKCN